MEQHKKGLRKSIRCDSCLKAHRQCSRSLPKCTNCIMRDVDCNYTFQTKYKKNTFDFEDKVNKFNIKDNLNLDSNKEKKKYRKKEMNYKVIKFNKEIIKENSFWNLIERFQKKEPLENLMTLLQYPSLYEPNRNLPLFLTIIKGTNEFIVQQKVSILPQKPLLIPNFYDSTLNEAFINFVNNNNTIFPLFVNLNIEFNSKNSLLKAAILASGLVWLKPTEITKQLIFFFMDKLYEHVKLTYLIRPTLVNLQIILILITGLESIPWVTILKGKLICQAFRIASLLGCHLSSKALSYNSNLEKALAHSILLYLHMNHNLLACYYVPTPFKHLTLTKTYDRLLQKLNNTKDNQTNNCTNLTTDCIFLLSSFYNDLNMILFLLRMLKNKYQNNLAPKDNLDLLAKELLVKSQKILKHYTNSLNLLTRRYPMTDELLYIRKIKYYVYFLTHYYNYFIRVLHFYGSSYTQHNKVHLSPQTKQKLKSTLNECSKVIYYASLLESHFMLGLSSAYLTQCIVFLIRYNDKIKLNWDNEIQSGISTLKKFSKLCNNNLMLKLNLEIIKMVKKYKS